MKVLELFGGIGACTKALKRLNIPFEVVDYVDNDKYAVASYNAINGTSYEPQDICQWDKNIEVDFIMHGSPCQDFSVAGKQAGGDVGSGTRSSLMYETIRIVGKLRPKYVVWENVKNLLSKKHKHNFDAYIETMNILGYNSYYQVLNAKDYGIPQNRERVFTVSIRKDIDKKYDFPKAEENKNKIDRMYGLYNQATRWGVYNEDGLAPTITASMGMGGGHVPMIEDKGFKFPEKEPLKLRLKDMLEEQVDEKYYLSDKAIQGLKKQEELKHKPNYIENKEIVNTIDTKVGDGTHFSPYLRENAEPKVMIKNATKKGYDEAIDGDSINLSYPESTTRRGRVGHGVAQTLQCNDSMGVVEAEIKVLGNYMPSNHDASRIVDSDGLAPTVKENHGTVTAVVESINKKAKHQQDLVQSEEGICRTIPAGTHGSTPHLLKTIVTCNDSMRVVEKEYERTPLKFLNRNQKNIDGDYAFCVDSCNTGGVKEIDGSNLRIRKLTPKECWRLMGFDDEDFEKAKKVNSNTQLYKQAGNSIVVNVLEKIFKKLLEGE